MDTSAIFDRFRVLSGSGQIASEFALAGLAEWLKRRCPRRILEIGAGIGTCSEVIRRWMITDFAVFVDVEVVCVEDDPWCQAQWSQNLYLRPPGMRLVDKIPNEFFDFLILDGPQIRPEDWAVLAEGATVFVEGNRRPQRQILERYCNSADESLGRLGRPYAKAQFKSSDRSKGMWIYRLNPTPGERLWFLAVRIREWLLDLPLRLIGQPVGKRRL